MRGTGGPRFWLVALFIALVAAAGRAEEHRSPTTVGWRGNWTGLFPDADPPIEWARIAKGVVAGMTCQAARPADGAARTGQPLPEALVRDWLVIGPFRAADSVKEFDQAQIPGEADLRPAEGDKAGEAAWRHLELPKKPDYERWGTTELDWLNLAPLFGTDPNQIVYVHTYLYCGRPGKVFAVVDHGYGLKAWVNGKEVYKDPRRAMGLGSYVGISRQKQDLFHQRSPKFELDLAKGWNRLLLKTSTANQAGWNEFQFALRLIDAGPVPYEEKNILWMAELPERTNAAPVIVGDRIFTPAEPDELICLDKNTGRILWRTFNGLYDAVPKAERDANAVFREKLDPLAEQLKTAADYEKGLDLRRQMRDLLLGLDPKKYKLKWDGHLAAHFGIVGFTTTPVSDGKYVYAFFGHGVVACYDLEGRRQWIRRLEADRIYYSCSPALIGGKVLTIFGGLHALDAKTGEIAWSLPDVASTASLIPARIKGTDCVFTRQGVAYRARDGKKLWANPHIREGDTGWGAGTVIGEVLYLSWLGITNLIVADFSEVETDAWQPKVRVIELEADHRRPNGEWLDRSTAGSPLIYDGAFHGIDQFGVFYAMDLKSGKSLYRKDVGFDEMHHYNGIGVGASATLGGKNVYVVDNQGVCVVLRTGPEYKPLAVNRIETILPRDWPIPPQEILANGPPVFDGRRMYLRGEKYLYCIAARP
jgi:hypothetical protein